MHFNEIQTDALREIFNISIHQAAATLSNIVQQPISLSIPNVEICTIQKAIQVMNVDENICGISQNFLGDFSGKAILIFPEHRSLDLVRLMVGINTSHEQVKELEQDALIEVGNVVLNSCLSSLSVIINQCFEFSVPVLVVDRSYMLFRDYDENQLLILLQVKFTLENRELEGSIIFVANVQSMIALQSAVELFLRDIVM